MAGLAGELTRLFALHRAGALDAEQFAAAKAAVLGEEPYVCHQRATRKGAAARTPPPPPPPGSGARTGPPPPPSPPPPPRSTRLEQQAVALAQRRANAWLCLGDPEATVSVERWAEVWYCDRPAWEALQAAQRDWRKVPPSLFDGDRKLRVADLRDLWSAAKAEDARRRAAARGTPDLAASLRAARAGLRETETRRATAGVVQAKELGQGTGEWFEVNIEKWERPLAAAGLTPRTISVPVTGWSDVAHIRNGTLPRGAPLRASLEAAFADLDAGRKGCVMKLCRSAKDVSSKGPRLAAGYHELVAEWRARGRGRPARPPRLTAIALATEASSRALRTYSVDEALGMFAQSGRIRGDCDEALGMRDQGRATDASAVLQVHCREWISGLPLWGELRGYCHRGRLTAISQYATELYFPELIDQQGRELAARLEVFFRDTVEPMLRGVVTSDPPDSYILDFAVCPESGDIWIIELNPWACSTDACLFSWFVDEDSDILHGRAQAEGAVLRVRERPPTAEQLAQLNPELLTLIDGPVWR